MRSIALVAATLGVSAAFAATVRPADDGRALVNPGMGWTMHYYSNIPRNYGSSLEPGDSAEWFPGCSVVYLRLPWAYLEPEEGKFNWAAIDTPAQRWIARGGQVAFRITTSENWLEYATPKWVFDAGAKGVRYKFGWGREGGPNPDGKAVDPDFLDPVYLEKLERFMRAFAARYDGRSEVAFVDVGTYGLWGEGHTHGSSRVPLERRDEGVKRHIDLHLRYFKRTRLVISDDVSGSAVPEALPALLAYARERGVSWRDDSIMVQPPPKSWFHAAQAEEFWRRLPVVLEHEHYGSSKQKGAWVPELLLKAVEDHHASYMSIHWDPAVLLAENREIVDRINRRLGFRFRPVEVSWPDVVKTGTAAEEFKLRWTWANAGVAPCLDEAHPALTVMDDKGRIQAVLADGDFDFRTLTPGPEGAAPERTHEFAVTLGRWQAPTFRPGEYSVFVSVGKADGTPVYELPLAGGDGRRRYRLGSIRFE